MRRLVRYIHHLSDWPQFRWNHETLAGSLAEIRHRQGRLVDRMESLGFTLQEEAELETLTLEVLKSSEIEGEKLNAAQVRSSIARCLGIETAGAVPAEPDVKGVVEMMLDATQNYWTNRARLLREVRLNPDLRNPSPIHGNAFSRWRVRPSRAASADQPLLFRRTPALVTHGRGIRPIVPRIGKP